MTKFIYINSIDSPPQWEGILMAAIEYSNEFAIVFPNGEYDADNPLLAGMLEFKQLPNLSISPWPNMKDSSVYRGVLDADSKKLILQYTLNDTLDSLWNFSLYKDDTLVINVADFSECFIYPNPVLISLLTQNDIDLSRFDRW